MTTSFGLFRPKILKNFKIPISRSIRSVSSNKDCAKDAEFEVVRPEPKNFADCIDLMWNTYFLEEPISKTLCISRNKILDNYLYNALCGGHSFIAKTLDHGCVIGGCLNVVTSPADAEDLQDLACAVTDKKLRSILKVWSFTKKCPDLWTEYGVPKIFDVGQPFVHELERCKGIGRELLRLSIASASECGYPLARFAATGSVSECFAEKLKLCLIQEIPYQNYVDQDCKPLVQPPPPNYSIKIYVSEQVEKQSD